MEVLLVCSGGISASIFIKKLYQRSLEKHILLHVTSCNLAQLKPCDLILLSPQVSYARKNVRAYVSDDAHILQISSFDYASLRCDTILDEICALHKKGNYDEKINPEETI